MFSLVTVVIYAIIKKTIRDHNVIKYTFGKEDKTKKKKTLNQS